VRGRAIYYVDGGLVPIKANDSTIFRRKSAGKGFQNELLRFPTDSRKGNVSQVLAPIFALGKDPFSKSSRKLNDGFGWRCGGESDVQLRVIILDFDVEAESTFASTRQYKLPYDYA
jgi:hypothetical protein